jgi:tight adherence protein C
MNVDGFAVGIATIGVLALGAIIAAGIQITRRRTDVLVERIADPISVSPVQWAPLADKVGTPRRGFMSAVAELVSLVARPKRAEEVARIRARLFCAGFRGEHAVSAFLLAKVLLSFGLLVLALWWNARRVTGGQPTSLLAVVTFAGGFYLPDLLVLSRVRTRQTAIERGLADALDLLVTCVEAGLGLDAALQRVAGEVRLAHPLLGDELSTTFLEVKAGIPRVEAFRRLALRTGVKALKSLAATLTQTEIFGTSVALALRIQAEGIRTRRMQRAEERAGYIAVKMAVPLVLCILPALVLVVAGPALVKASRQLPQIFMQRGK